MNLKSSISPRHRQDIEKMHTAYERGWDDAIRRARQILWEAGVADEHIQAISEELTNAPTG